MHSPTEGSDGGAVSYERGTPVGFGVHASWFGVEGLGFTVLGSGFIIQGLGPKVLDPGFRVKGSGARGYPQTQG